MCLVFNIKSNHTEKRREYNIPMLIAYHSLKHLDFKTMHFAPELIVPGWSETVPFIKRSLKSQRN